MQQGETTGRDSPNKEHINRQQQKDQMCTENVEVLGVDGKQLLGELELR